MKFRAETPMRGGSDATDLIIAINAEINVA